jgi:hypothetical protein
LISEPQKEVAMNLKTRKVFSRSFLIFIGMLAFVLLVSIACNLPVATPTQDVQDIQDVQDAQAIQDTQDSQDAQDAQDAQGASDVQDVTEEITSTIGVEGGIVNGPGKVSLTVPEGAFAEPVDIHLAVGGEPPKLPVEAGIEAAGAPVEVTLPPDVGSSGIFELAVPFERSGSTPVDQYTVLRWDGQNWTSAGGMVDGDLIRVYTNGFSTFLPARVVWALRPVSFVNDGPYDAVVMPWTYLPLDPFSGVLPPRLATASFAPGGPGLWPNPSRFLGLPLGTYTFCIEWDEDVDSDSDGKTDEYHAFLEGPSSDLPLMVDENDPIEMEFAEEVRFWTDPVGKLEGRCEQDETAIASQLSVRLLPLDVRTLADPPDTIAYAQYDTTPPPENVTIESVQNIWKSGDGQNIALYHQGDWIAATCSDTDVTTVGVYFDSDANDGWVRILVDGREVWRGNIWGGEAGHYRNYLEVSGLAAGPHTIMAENLGIDGGGGDDDTAMRYFGFSSRPVQAP